MNKIILSITGCWFCFGLRFLVQLRREKRFLQPEIDVEIGNGFSKISDLVTRSIEAKNSGKSVVSDWMIVTNPYASDVGANILLRGGTAADAMVNAKLYWVWFNHKVQEWAVVATLV